MFYEVYITVYYRVTFAIPSKIIQIGFELRGGPSSVPSGDFGLLRTGKKDGMNMLENS